MRGNSHVRCGVGENLEITSKSYPSLSDAKPHTLWTQAGRLFIYELLKEDGIIPLIEKENHNE